MNFSYKLGIDIGSTTIKLVVLDKDNQVVYKKYMRHLSEIYKSMHDNMILLSDTLKNHKFSCAITGSAGMGMANNLNMPFVQEVIACSKAVKNWIPQTDVAVELGGEDAKITYFGSAPEQRMNGVCAGGTGSFIDHMASLLNTDAMGLNELAQKGTQIYTIASRCGVFAKTDVQALLNDGVSKADIALSILQAVVNQTIGNLAQGRPLEGNIAFLGGPLYFLTQLKERFIKTLKLTDEHIVNVDDGCYFVAMGCALSDNAIEMTYDELMQRLNNCSKSSTETESVAFTLFKNEQEYNEFKQRHNKDVVKKALLSDYQGPLYIGIDAGSTTTKLVAISKNREILYSSYGSNNGSPLKTVLDEIKALYEIIPPNAYIATVGTTGYGEHIVKAALHADFGEVETFAHLRAAREFCPDVSCVLDIGGQDMKCFYVNKGNIGQIILNEACSAGCGSFIQNFAQGLNMEVSDFANKGLTAKNPVDLGTRCTVFMNSRVKQAQKEGASVNDISAGIALSVIKNALFKVIQVKDVSELGDNIVVQGGTFYNDAVLRSMELLLNKNVIRPDISGLMGAYGIALLAIERQQEKSSILTKEELKDFHMETKTYRCHGCGNNCLITTQIFPDGNRYSTGNRCEKGIGKQVAKEDKAPNIYKYKYHRLFEYYKPLLNAPKGRIGIPRVLNMYEDFPFWFTFFTLLGYEVVLSGKSSAQLYCKGMSTIPSDSLCYPGKLVHGHIMDLIEKDITTIFYPCIPYNMKDPLHASDNNYNCPIVASYAENIRANMDILRQKNINFLQPFLPINNKKALIKRLQEELSSLNIPKKDLIEAVEKSYQELDKYKEDIRNYGENIIKEATDKKMPIVVLAGRPYHVDPEINHGIPEMIQSYNIAILSEDALYHLDCPEDNLDIVNQWSYHARLYHAASYVARHKNMTLIQLSSFGCGLDAITTGQVREILEQHGDIYTIIKLDEVSNLGAARIRIRSLMAAWKYGFTQIDELEPPKQRAYFSKDCQKTHTILAPQMSPRHFDFIQHACQKAGLNVIIPPMPTQEDIDLGLRYINNDMCYPAIIVIGQLLKALKSGNYDVNNTSIMLFQTCGACRATNYLNLMRKALENAGLSQVPVFACVGRETDDFKLKTEIWLDVVKATIYADLLIRLSNRTRPYEKVAGSVDVLYNKWRKIFMDEITNGNYIKFSNNIKKAVKEFDELALDESITKPKVGIVGEILVKYHPTANNHVEKVLFDEGAEVVTPDLMDFFMYMAYDDIIKYKMLDGKWIDKAKSEIFIKVLEFFRKPMCKALRASKRFTAPYTIKEIAKLTTPHVSLGNMAGEGWFLTGEMAKLIQEGVDNIICLQPFGCLPNHITGKGMIRELMRTHDGVNIVAIDCDAGISEVNQLNRIKLMLSVAKEKIAEQDHKAL
ncbi:acyl-CoA dehydratase activase-related protein [Megamonas funiformis]|uniref:acyl-CoA dehydratase activase-related protein n=1 Tax=Megamonas funiformis TaxID=437897 RepID=UPI002942B9E7|nr:acyl-CoA dehydratase activase-related protein [Megamonas funiformis]